MTRSLRGLLLTGLVALQVAVLAGVGVTVFGWARAEAHQALHDTLRVRARNLAGMIEMDRDGLEVEASPKALPEYHAAGSGVYAVVYDASGESVVHSGSLGEMEIAPDGEWEEGAFAFRESVEGPDGFPCAVGTFSFLLAIETSSDDGGEPTAWTPPTMDERRYTMVLALDSRPRDAALARLRNVLAALCGGALVLTAGGGLLLARRVLRPIARMTEEASALTPEDTTRRLGPDTVVRELGGLGTTLNSALDRLGDALERQRRFTSDASHELRTPLAVLRGNVDFLLRRQRPAEDYRKGLARQRRVVGQMTRITENLLALARADDGAANIRREPVDLPRLARDVCDDFAPLAEEARVRLACEMTGDETLVRGDDVYLGELLQNLVANAVKFTPEGGDVTVRIVRSAGDVILDVVDTGPGIPPEHRKDVFRRFYRVGNGTDPRSGAGLGLAITAWIVREHGGEIEVLERPGGGSVFRVRLPSPEAAVVSAA